MQLHPHQVERLNQLLADRELKLPGFRRVVTAGGGNYQWLRRNLAKFNADRITAELTSLLALEGIEACPPHQLAANSSAPAAESP